MEEMKPCPFCGCKEQQVHKTTMLSFVECEQCNARSQFGETEEQAVKFWNKRSDLVGVQDAEKEFF